MICTGDEALSKNATNLYSNHPADGNRSQCFRERPAEELLIKLDEPKGAGAVKRTLNFLLPEFGAVPR